MTPYANIKQAYVSGTLVKDLWLPSDMEQSNGTFIGNLSALGDGCLCLLLVRTARLNDTIGNAKHAWLRPEGAVCMKTPDIVSTLLRGSQAGVERVYPERARDWRVMRKRGIRMSSMQTRSTA